VALLPPAPPRFGPGSAAPQTERDWLQMFSYFNNVSQYLTALSAQIAGGQSVTMTLAKLTTGGTNGSITFTNGIETGHVNPT
jgi:hypothetical protein